MESKINYSVIGAFIIILLTLLIFLIIWLSSGISERKYNTYIVYMNEAVTGLNTGGSVKFNGVDVGHVKSMHLNENNLQQVKLLLDIDTNVPITEDTRATLMSQGLTGLTFISLRNIGNNIKPLHKAKNESYPIIISTPSIFLRLDIILTKLTTNIDSVSKDLKALLNNNNQQAIQQTLTNINNFTKSFNQQTLPAANQLLENMQHISNNVATITQEIKQNPAILLREQAPQKLGPGEK